MTEPSSAQFRPDQLEFLTVLGLAPPVTEEDVKQAYLDKAKSAHPDRGGDVENFKRLQDAFEQATEYARFKAGRMQWLSSTSNRPTRSPARSAWTSPWCSTRSRASG
jgi:hypothetical protein